MPTPRRQSRHRTASVRGGGQLRVFSIDKPLTDARAMARLLHLIAAEHQAEREGRPAPHVAGLDKLADLRPDTHAATGDQTTEARDA